MPTLGFVGKDRVAVHAREVPFHVLERMAGKGVLDEHGTDAGNKIIHGDNLLALKALLPEYEGRVDVVYIDPPYNTGNEGWVYNDNMGDPRMRAWLDRVVGKEGEDFSRHDKWLCMMYPRLVLLRQLLAPTGAIFISADDNEEASLRLIGDEIFGTSCFVANISWQRTYSTRNDSKGIPAEVEHILVYGKQPDWQPRKLERTAEMDAKYKNPDGDVAPWRSSDAFAPGAATHQGMVYAIQHPFTGELLYPYNGSCWRYQQDQMLEYMRGWCEYELRDLDDAERRAQVCGIAASEVRAGVKAIVLAQPLEESRVQAEAVLARGKWPRFFFSKNGQGGIARKTYIDSVGGRLPTNLWPYTEVGHTDEAKKELKAIFDSKLPFDTPKPVRLIERILQIAGGPDALVLDSFAGSGTTAHAVLRQNQRDGGHRRFILCEMMDYAESVTAERVRRVISGYTAQKNEKTVLFEQKLTFATLKNAQTYREQALAVADEAKRSGTYAKVEGPKLADSAITVTGVTAKGEQVPGTGGGFSYYELGPALFDEDGYPSAGASREALCRYVWFAATREAAPMAAEFDSGRQDVSANAREVDDGTPYDDLSYLGISRGVAYFLAYSDDHATSLDRSLLARAAALLREHAPAPAPALEGIVVYADACTLPQDLMDAHGIVFRKIPRDIPAL